ncbi:MAG: GNAT family N-acetyltransferase [Deltaproteobacteria bacterium]|nr:GNAT family N-acetyltransferase [Deltaproteobacteria bacterium]
MSYRLSDDWKKKIVTPEEVLAEVKPGMSIFLGTGQAEPRTLVKHLMMSDQSNLRDLELVQLVSFGDAIPIDERYRHKYRLKTFFAGWLASEAITAGRIDLVPSRTSSIPWLFRSGSIDVDVAFIQISTPDEQGFASLGIAIDAARYAMDCASLVVGEINEDIPCTLGDTFVHAGDFDFLVQSTEKPLYLNRWPYDDSFDKLAANVATVIKDGSCIHYSIGPLFEALPRHLEHKHDLGIHTITLTDAVMDLVRTGVVTNRKKDFFRGKTVAAYALGTDKLLKWIHRNPLIEFQGIDVIANPQNISQNDNFIAILPARKVDITGGIALHTGKGNVNPGPGEVQEMFAGAALSKGGRTVFALPSRNLKGQPNIMLSVEEFPNQFTNRESLDMIATEYGVASLRGKTVRERALALIDIAHPDDRGALVQMAKTSNILYRDQIYLTESGHLYPHEISYTQTFKGGTTIRFRPIKPSDEDDMRRLFYRFSDQAVYYRYFSPIKTMPHMKMQEYVNVDFKRTMSIVGIIEEEGHERIIAEARYVRLKDRPTFADVAFITDEKYQGIGIGSYLLRTLIKLAKKNDIEGFTADVITDNKPMIKVFEKLGYPIHAVVNFGVYEFTIPFTEEGDAVNKPQGSLS